MLYCLQQKCELYWPQQISESREFGKITVTLIECSEFSEFTKRLMKIEHEVMVDLSEVRYSDQSNSKRDSNSLARSAYRNIKQNRIKSAVVMRKTKGHLVTSPCHFKETKT